MDEGEGSNEGKRKKNLASGIQYGRGQDGLLCFLIVPPEHSAWYTVGALINVHGWMTK